MACACVKGLTVEERFDFVWRNQEKCLVLKQKMSIETGIGKGWNRVEIREKSIENKIDRWQRFNLRCRCVGPLELSRCGVAGAWLDCVSVVLGVGTGIPGWDSGDPDRMETSRVPGPDGSG